MYIQTIGLEGSPFSLKAVMPIEWSPGGGVTCLKTVISQTGVGDWYP